MEKIPADSRGFFGSLLACMFYINYIIKINIFILIVFLNYFYLISLFTPKPNSDRNGYQIFTCLKTKTFR